MNSLSCSSGVFGNTGGCFVKSMPAFGSSGRAAAATATASIALFGAPGEELPAALDPCPPGAWPGVGAGVCVTTA